MRFAAFFSLLFVPALAQAHEVYVLPRDAIESAMTMPPLQVFDIILANTGSFFFWGFIALWAVFTIFSISISKPIEKHVAPRLLRLKPYAPLVLRVALGAAIIACGIVRTFFGSELPLSDLLPQSAIVGVHLFLVVTGVLILAGLFTRVAALAILVLYAVLWLFYGTYMLTYTDYAGAAALIFLIGGTHHALDCYLCHLYPNVFQRFAHTLREHAFVILRVSFGISLVFASVYAKYLHAQLALETVTRYGLTNYFPFEPSFIVLGAFCIELLLGLFFIFGIEVRFASLFLLFWLTLSLLYFQEAVWPHIILAGAATAIFMHGYDRYTIQLHLMHMRRKNMREPML